MNDKTTKRLGFIALLVTCLAPVPFVASCGGGDGSSGACGPTSGEITAVTDGDTLEVTTDDDTTVTVRLLLTDTPETTKNKDECYGQQAKKLTQSFKYKRVTLSYDKSDGSCTDMYGRYLAYVLPEGESKTINEQLVGGGYARVCRTSCDEDRFQEFMDLESDAKESEKGVWNQDTCPGSTDLTTWGASGCVKCTGGGSSSSGDCPTKGEITEVTDGDTMKVTDEDGEEFTIRLLLTDTPETTKGKNECYGQDAKSFTQSFKYKQVTLSYESGDSAKDRYGRCLAYVLPKGAKKTINEQLVSGGYARVCRIDCDESRYDDFASMESAAQKASKGVWGECEDAYDLSSWGASGCVSSKAACK